MKRKDSLENDWIFFFQENLRRVIILVLSHLILSPIFLLLNPELAVHPHPGRCLHRYATELNSYSLEIRHIHIVLILKNIFFLKWENLTLKGRESQRVWDWRPGRNKELFSWPHGLRVPSRSEFREPPPVPGQQCCVEDARDCGLNCVTWQGIFMSATHIRECEFIWK